MLKVQKATKFLIILTYFNRPNMVRNALHSVAYSACSNWHLAFHDDGSTTPGEPIAREIIPEEKITFYRNDNKPQEGNIGHCINEIIRTNMHCDVAILLADDDALHPDYLTKLEEFFKRNNNAYYASCYVSPYNPMKETYFTALKNFKVSAKTMNNERLDSSQIAWSLDANKYLNLWLPEKGIKDYDVKFINRMKETGMIWETGYYGQFKGTHQRQLGKCDHRWAMSGGKLDCNLKPELPEKYAVNLAVDPLTVS
jgi:glycosyltransferase involved in cell wall biosynthesis